MVWSAVFNPDAERDIASLPRLIQSRVVRKIVWLTQEFDVVRPIPTHGDWSGFYKLRVGDYRVLYTFDREARTIRISYVDHRSRIYKRKN